MTNISRTLLVALGTILFFVGCKKSELTKYDQPDKVYVYKLSSDANKDSATFSFALRPSAQLQDTVKIPLRIMGTARGADRQVQVNVVADSSTGVAGTHYQLLPAIIPANSFTGYIPVLVKKTPDMKTTEFRLWVEVGTSADFQPGIPTSLRYLVKINNFFTKPSNWDSQLVGFFGAFSQVKYGFIINVTGRSEFSFSGTDAINSPMATYYKVQCKNALADYNAANGTLYDEFGLPITFPN